MTGVRHLRCVDELRPRINVVVEAWRVRDHRGRFMRPRRVHVMREHNLVTSAGRNLLRDFLATLAPAAITHFAVGTSNTAAATTDTALGAEVLRDVVTSRTASDLALTVKYFLATGSANGNTLREAGLLNAAVAGTLFARVVLSAPIVKTNSIAVTFSWTISLPL